MRPERHAHMCGQALRNRWARAVALCLLLAAAPRPAMAQAADASPAAGPAVPHDAPRAASGRDAYRGLVRAEAARAGLPPDLADAVAETESSYDPATVGAAGEIGLMQVMPATARMLGFSGTLDELAVPATNIRLGVTYLAQAWRLAAGDICTAVMKYRAGHGETRFSYLSVSYCVKVRAKLLARGYPVTGVVPAPTFGDPLVVRAGPLRRLRLAAERGPDIAAINRQLQAIVTAVKGAPVGR